MQNEDPFEFFLKWPLERLDWMHPLLAFLSREQSFSWPVLFVLEQSFEFP